MNFKGELDKISVDGLEHLEADHIKVMNQIQKPKRKKAIYYYPVLLITSLLLFFLSPFNLDYAYYEHEELNWIAISDEFRLLEVSANEYRIQVEDEKEISFGLSVLVENVDIIQIDEKYSYYKDFKKYTELTEYVEVIGYDIFGFKFLELKINANLSKYFIIINDEYSTNISELKLEFTDFEEEMAAFLSYYYKNEPKVIEKMDKAHQCSPTVTYERSTTVNEADDYYTMYMTFIDTLSQRFYAWESIPECKLVRPDYVVNYVYLDSIDLDQANVIEISGSSGSGDLSQVFSDIEYFMNTPFIVNECDINSSSSMFGPLYNNEGV